MKNNILSALLHILVVIIYSQINQHEVLFMYICWLVGYSKNIFDVFKTN